MKPFADILKLDKHLKEIGWEVVDAKPIHFLEERRAVKLDLLFTGVPNPQFSYTLYESDEMQWLAVSDNLTGREIKSYSIRKKTQ